MGLFSVSLTLFIFFFWNTSDFYISFIFILFFFLGNLKKIAATVDISTEIGLHRSPDMPSERATLKQGLPWASIICREGKKHRHTHTQPPTYTHTRTLCWELARGFKELQTKQRQRDCNLPQWRRTWTNRRARKVGRKQILVYFHFLFFHLPLEVMLCHCSTHPPPSVSWDSFVCERRQHTCPAGVGEPWIFFFVWFSMQFF